MNKLRENINNAVGLREVLLISGLSLLAWGLYQLYPWLSYSVTGAILLLAGFFLREVK
ncbi:MAG TPA: hypothetical protein VLH56_02520 [Dissulfurispiraceae bacterium]|nr:hypothetical protein [Dissulfurispiraceae bacterium]